MTNAASCRSRLRHRTLGAGGRRAAHRQDAFGRRCAATCAAWSRHIRARWKTTRITFRGDGHYARPEAMDWCEASGVDYVFGLTGTPALAKKVDGTADAVRTERAVADKAAVRDYTQARHRAGTWGRERRAVARIEATKLGLDIRYVVHQHRNRNAPVALRHAHAHRAAKPGEPDQAAQRPSSPQPARPAAPPVANQVRLALRTAAYWPDARPARGRPQGPRPRPRGICDAAPARSRSPQGSSKPQAACASPSRQAVRSRPDSRGTKPSWAGMTRLTTPAIATAHSGAFHRTRTSGGQIAGRGRR